MSRHRNPSEARQTSARIFEALIRLAWTGFLLGSVLAGMLTGLIAIASGAASPMNLPYEARYALLPGLILLVETLVSTFRWYRRPSTPRYSLLDLWRQLRTLGRWFVIAGVALAMSLLGMRILHASQMTAVLLSGAFLSLAFHWLTGFDARFRRDLEHRDTVASLPEANKSDPILKEMHEISLLRSLAGWFVRYFFSALYFVAAYLTLAAVHLIRREPRKDRRYRCNVAGCRFESANPDIRVPDVGGALMVRTKPAPDAPLFVDACSGRPHFIPTWWTYRQLAERNYHVVPNPLICRGGCEAPTVSRRLLILASQGARLTEVLGQCLETVATSLRLTSGDRDEAHHIRNAISGGHWAIPEDDYVFLRFRGSHNSNQSSGPPSDFIDIEIVTPYDVRCWMGYYNGIIIVRRDSVPDAGAEGIQRDICSRLTQLAHGNRDSASEEETYADVIVWPPASISGGLNCGQEIPSNSNAELGAFLKGVMT